MSIFRNLSRPVKLFLFALLLGALALEYRSITSAQFRWENHPRDFGTRDFVAYWAAYQVWERGENPYEQKNVLAEQQKIFPEQHQAQVFLNPPWALAMLAPLISLPFQAGRLVWLALSLCCWIGTALLLRKLYRAEQVAPAQWLVLSVFFLPAIYCLWVGQQSFFMLFFLVAGALAFERRQDLAAGFLFLPLILKPHLLLPLAGYLFIRIVLERRFVVLGAFLFGLLLFAGGIWMADPAGFAHWRAMDFSPFIYRTPTIVTHLRLVIQQTTGNLALWPVYLVPAAAVGLVMCLTLFGRIPSTFSTALPLLIAVSLIFSPYLWFYDFTLLLIVQLGAISLATANHKSAKRTLIALISLQLLLMLSGQFSANMQYSVWFPLAIFAIWFSNFRKQNCIQP